MVMGRVFDATGSYTWLLTVLAGATLGSAGLFLLLPRYGVAGAGAADVVE